MEMSLGSAIVTLDVWVLVATTTLASGLAALAAYLLGRFRPHSWPRRWLLRAAATVLVLLSFWFTGRMAHLFVYVTTPELRGHSVLICFGDPHWNMAFGVFLPPVVAFGVFLASRHVPARPCPATSVAPGTGSTGA